MSEIVNIHDAKTHLSRLVARASAGEEIVLARAGVPVARLVPLASDESERAFGVLRDRLEIPDSFWDPLPPEELNAWGQ